MEDRFFEVKSLRELKDYDEIYLDSSIFQSMWSEIEELLKEGKRVFYFRRPWKWRELRDRFSGELRERFGKKKSDFGDAYILSKIPRSWKWFREITSIDVELKPLLTLEKVYYKSYQRLLRLKTLGVDVDRDIDEVESRISMMRSKVVEKAKEIIPMFDEIYNRLGLDKDDVNGLYGLAGTLTYLGWPETVIPYHYSLRFLGLYKVKNDKARRFKRIQGNAKRLFMIYTEAIAKKRSIQWPPRLRFQRQLLRELIHLLSRDKGAYLRAGAKTQAGLTRYSARVGPLETYPRSLIIFSVAGLLR
ncbi:MAG: hypothetical protein QXF28_07645 [Nitrososphaerota archaeon]